MSTGFPAVAELLPHRGAMILLDEVFSFEERSIRCSASIEEGHPFLEDGKVDAVVCIELVAQAVAVYASLRDRAAGRTEKRLGFLVSVREATFELPSLELHDALTVEATHRFGEETLGAFSGRVIRKGTVVMTADIGVWRGSLDDVRKVT